MAEETLCIPHKNLCSRARHLPAQKLALELPFLLGNGAEPLAALTNEHQIISCKFEFSYVRACRSSSTHAVAKARMGAVHEAFPKAKMLELKKGSCIL